MKTTCLALAIASAAFALSASVGAHPGGGRAMGGAAGSIGHPTNSPMGGVTTTNTSQGSTHGVGWNHTNGPAHTTGQPGDTCGSATAPNTPGNAAGAPGSAFNSSGTAGTKYAGQQPQNQRNSAASSQYDVACAHQR
jgi:hypothetical protein